MSTFDDATITRFSQEGEADFITTNNCLLKRISLATVSGTALITIPDDVLSIKRITWRGYKLDPLPSRNFREVFQNAEQQGRPFWYVFNNIGQNQLQLFPAPNETLAAATTNLWGSEIANSLIIEYFCASDYSTLTIPAYFRRRLLKSYVLRACFNIEGQQQNLTNSKYFKKRYMNLAQLYGQLLSDLTSKPRKLVITYINADRWGFPGFAMLPIDRFGISVDKGE